MKQLFDRDAVLARAKYKCERCGTDLHRKMYSIHHRKPRGMGGTKNLAIHSPVNLLVLCGSGTTGCHGWVESNRLEARGLGLLVSHWSDPSEISYEDINGNVWMLTDDYQRVPHPGVM